MSDESQRFSKELLGLTGSFGLNAMTISDLTGIPRPTVIRKLRSLVNNKFIRKNDSGLYNLNDSTKTTVDVEKLRIKNMYRISSMLCKLLNTARLNLKKN